MPRAPDKKRPAAEPATIYVHMVSDATGTGSERVARAGLVQFHKDLYPIFVKHPFIKTTQQLSRILDKAEAQGGMVFYIMTDRAKRAWLSRQKAKRGILIIDMLEPLLREVGRYYKSKPELSSSLLPRALGERSLQLAQAINFTMRHDDGRGLDTIGQADIILLGVSRSSKTPTSFYLSCHYALKVANVPLSIEVPPPEKIFRLKRPRMVGLSIHPAKLARVRRARFHDGAARDYADARYIMRELAYAEEIFERIKDIEVIDVTERPIEEICNLIV